MATRRRIGVSAASTEAARRQLMQPVSCWERTWTTPENIPNIAFKVRKWTRTDKPQVLRGHSHYLARVHFTSNSVTTKVERPSHWLLYLMNLKRLMATKKWNKTSRLPMEWNLRLQERVPRLHPRRRLSLCH